MLLQPEQIDGWLSGAIGRESLVPAREEMLQTWPVSRRVNSSRTDENDATLIEGLSAWNGYLKEATTRRTKELWRGGRKRMKKTFAP
jgi:hypothetical protein